MPTETGIFTKEEAETGHLFSYRIAQYIGITLKRLKPLPIYDYGCGPASYLRYLADIGFPELLGIEGTQDAKFEVPKYMVMHKDLTVPLNLGRRPGDAICLEVGEHIPEQYQRIFLDNITELISNDGFLFLSWAVPGQEGTGHVNCKSNEWVIGELAIRGFRLNHVMTHAIREVVENHLAYFRDTLFVFQREN